MAGQSDLLKPLQHRPRCRARGRDHLTSPGHRGFPRRGKTPIGQSLPTVKGDPGISLKLGNGDTYSPRTYAAELLWCFKCQRRGHHQLAKAKSKCGLSSKPHSIEVWLKVHKEGHIDTNDTCSNCGKWHQAWSLVHRVSKEAALNRSKKRSDFVPAPTPQAPMSWNRRRTSTPSSQG